MLAGSCARWGQSETTSAITGQVLDRSGGAVAGATVTVTHGEMGLRRQVHTDESGRFGFPELRPGSYSVPVPAAGFDDQVNPSATARLGGTRSVNFTVKISEAQADMPVMSEAPLINVENPNPTTTLTGKAIQDLPNPGGDMTYPAQFAPGALINTAGS